MINAETYREVGEAAWAWVLGQVRTDDGPWLPDVVTDAAPSGPADDRDSLYAGIAGLAPVLAEITAYRRLTEVEQALAAGIVDRLSVMASRRIDASLYDGLAGDVTALKLLAPGREQVAMHRLAELQTPAGWNPIDAGQHPASTSGSGSGSESESGSASGSESGPALGPAGPYTDLVMGTAGVVLAAAWAGGDVADQIMSTACESLLRVAEPTEAGLDWRMRPGSRGSSPNFSHGTAGVATALTIAGHALGRPDFLHAAERGVRHLLAVGSLDGGGFIVPHNLPYSQREVEPVTYSWCHGPTGTSQLFAALALAGVEQVDGFAVAELRQRCLHSVLTSGLPERLRPGFWDNDGRCCGTAGVGDVLLDAAQDAALRVDATTQHSTPQYSTAQHNTAQHNNAQHGTAQISTAQHGTAQISTAQHSTAQISSAAGQRWEQLRRAAEVMGDALVDRAVQDAAGARWQFIEYRQDPPLLPPGTSWMQGAAGIAAFLLRLARVIEIGPTATVVDRPDQWWTVPAQVRRSAVAG